MATLIAKGLQDRLGRTFQIQAAGMKYNQSLNSVALGSDTQATGKDQFVFGRANVTDDDKAEIVGGGIQSQGEQYYITEIKYTDGVQLLHGVAYYDNMLKSPLKVVVRQIAIPTAYEGSGKYLAAYDIVEVVQQLEMNDQWYDTLARAISSGSATATREEARRYFRSFEDVYEGDKLLREKYGSSSSYSWHIEALEVTSDGQYFRSKSGDGHSGSGAYDPNFNFVTYPTRKNIRTLSWDGTQWNAGDVTCDDGKGNTISLREVASRTTGQGGTTDKIINKNNSYVEVYNNGEGEDDEIHINIHCADPKDECQHVLNRNDIDNIFGYTGQVTQGSSRLVTSGAVYNALQNAVSAYLPVYVSLVNNGITISNTGTSDSTHGLDALFNAASDGKIYMFNLSLSLSSGEMWTMPALVKVDSSNQKRIAYIATGEDIIKVVKNLQNNSISISHENSSEGPVSKFFGRASQSGSTDPASDIAIVAFNIDSSGVVTLASQEELVASIISQEAVGQRYIVLVRLWNKATNTIVEVPAAAETRSMTDNAQAYIGAYLNVGTKCIVIRKWTESGNITVVTQDLDNIFAAQN